MQFKSIFRAGIASLLIIYPVAAQAATLDNIRGGIFVSKGAGYHAAHAPVDLNAGDTVLANPNSTARVVYDDGCVVSVQPGMVFTVGETSPCTAAAVPSVLNWPLVVGAAVVAGGVGIAIAASGGGGDGGGRPASP